MVDTILQSVKKFLQVEDVDAFDGQIVPMINSALNTLNQNGAGKFINITKDCDLTWEDFRDPDIIPTSPIHEACQTYTMLKVKQLFDPPAPNTAGYLQSTIDELLWRINAACNGRIIPVE